MQALDYCVTGVLQVCYMCVAVCCSMGEIV